MPRPKRGDKWLRANCGGKLAKDESYGFLLTDLLHSALADRDDAIKLGEKLRKENKKVNERLKVIKKDKGKALGKIAGDAAAIQECERAFEEKQATLLSAVPNATRTH